MLFITFLIQALALDKVDAYTKTRVKPYAFMTTDPGNGQCSHNSHLHMFAGGQAKPCVSTSAELIASGCTSAANPNDFSGYWVPALINRNTMKAITPVVWAVYYFNINEGITKPLPRDIKLVAGDSKCQSDDCVDKDGARPTFYCDLGLGDPQDVQGNTKFPDHECPGNLKLLMYFPNCISPDGKHHRYAPLSWEGKAGPCEDGWTNIPQIRFNIMWDIPGLVPSRDLMLASGSEYSMHGDFLNGWLEETANKMLEAHGGSDLHHPAYLLNGPKGPQRFKPHGCRPVQLQPDDVNSCYTGHTGGDSSDGGLATCEGPNNVVNQSWL